MTVALVVVAAILFGAPTPARAHPFGEPQTVAIALDRDHPEVVHVRWKVGGLDDLTLLGVALGLLPRDRVLLDGAVFFQDSAHGLTRGLDPMSWIGVPAPAVGPPAA